MTNKSILFKTSPQMQGIPIEPPISAFNNIISDITQIISDIIFKRNFNNQSELRMFTALKHGHNLTNLFNLAKEDKIFFVDDSIMILGFFKLYLHDNNMLVKVLKPGLTWEELSILSAIYNNYDLITQQFFRYIMMFNRITKNFDDVPTELINQIIKTIKSKKVPTCSYLLPFKNKLTKNDVETNWDLYKNYEFVITFKLDKSKNRFSYSIIKVLSDEVKMSNSLEQIRYTEKDLIKTDTINFLDTEEFITQLFCYGNITKSVSLHKNKQK